MTWYTLRSKFVRSSLERLLDQPIHRTFPGYLCLQKQSSIKGRETNLSFPHKEFFKSYLSVGEAESEFPYFVPFDQFDRSSLESLWQNEAVDGVYAPSSLSQNSPFLKPVEAPKSSEKSTWGLANDHWKLARLELAEGAKIPVESLSAFLLRDYAFNADEPSAYTVVNAFTEEFGYGMGDAAFTHLYRTGDSEITQNSFVKIDEADYVTAQHNNVRSSTKVRKLGPTDLNIPTGREASDLIEHQWETLTEIAFDAQAESQVGVAARTIGGDIHSGVNLERGRSGIVHAIELAVWKAYSENRTPIEKIAIATSTSDFTPCDRCVQVIQEYSANAKIRLNTSDGTDWEEFETIGDMVFNRNVSNNQTQKPIDEDANDDIGEVVDQTETGDEYSEYIDRNSEENLELEYIRFETPIYHLKYKKVNRTFCGRELAESNYMASDEKPDLLTPCRSCHGEGHKTKEEQKSEIRRELSELVSGVLDANTEPGNFDTSEMTALLTEFSVKTPDFIDDPNSLRFQISRVVEGVSNSVQSPTKFDKSEMDALIKAIDGEGLISSEPYALVLSNEGNISRVSVNSIRLQHRGGKGTYSLELAANASVPPLVINPRNKILLFTDLGKVFKLDAYKVPKFESSKQFSRVSDLIALSDDEEVQSVTTVENILDYEFLVLASNDGYVKRTKTSEFENILSTGIKAIQLDGSKLVDVSWSNGDSDIIIETFKGNVIRFEEDGARPMGRPARGVKGIKLKNGDKVVSMATVSSDDMQLVTITKNGYGKRTELSEYRRQTRNGTGLVDIETGDRNGGVVDVGIIGGEEQIVVLGRSGRIIRFPAEEISVVNRNTKGVNIMDVADDNSAIGFGIIDE